MRAESSRRPRNRLMADWHLAGKRRVNRLQNRIFVPRAARVGIWHDRRRRSPPIAADRRRSPPARAASTGDQKGARLLGPLFGTSGLVSVPRAALAGEP